MYISDYLINCCCGNLYRYSNLRHGRFTPGNWSTGPRGRSVRHREGGVGGGLPLPERYNDNVKKYKSNTFAITDRRNYYFFYEFRTLLTDIYLAPWGFGLQYVLSAPCPCHTSRLNGGWDPTSPGPVSQQEQINSMFSWRFYIEREWWITLT